jgi:SAM-dependent methyltransferase
VNEWRARSSDGASAGADPWNERRDAYRGSPVHREGADLDTVVAWCGPASGRRALDVASGGGHVARRLRDLGFEVVSCDAAPGMEPDVVCPAERLPFDDATFDVVVCRLAAHHFDDPGRAVAEMARVTRHLVVVEDGLHNDERTEEAERLRDPTHVRAYSRGEWLELLGDAGLEVLETAEFERRHALEGWLAATGCRGDAAATVRALLAHRTVDDGRVWLDTKLVLRTARRDSESLAETGLGLP